MLGTIWSSSSGVTAIIDTLNQAYDVQEARPWWKVQLISLALTIALALFILLSFALVLVGPTVAERLAAMAHVGPAFAWTWTILQWPLVFALVALAMALIYYYAPDVQQEWIWITPGSVLATVLWLLISLGFKFYVGHFTSYNATYGAIGAVIVLMLWFYVHAGDFDTAGMLHPASDADPRASPCRSARRRRPSQGLCRGRVYSARSSSSWC